MLTELASAWRLAELVSLSVGLMWMWLLVELVSLSMGPVRVCLLVTRVVQREHCIQR